MRRTIALGVAVLVVSACGSGQEPRPVPDRAPAVQVFADDVQREASHTSRVPDPGPSREPIEALPPKPWVQPAPVYVPETPPEPKPTTKAPQKPTTPRATAPPKPATTAPKPSPTTTKPKPVGEGMRIGNWEHSITVAFGSQKSLDACNLVEWSSLWFAGHNYCGYQFWASLGIGTRIELTGSRAGVYVVTDRVYLPYQGGKIPGGLPAHDLVLQTCKGSGTQLVFAQKVG